MPKKIGGPQWVKTFLMSSKQKALWLITALATLFCIIATQWATPNKHKHNLTKAKTQIVSIDSALSAFFSDGGDVPEGFNLLNQRDQNARLFEMLTGKSAINNQRRTYITIASVNEGLIDPWGTPYNIRIAKLGNSAVTPMGKIVSDRFCIWSNGPNLKDDMGAVDDIVNWQSHGR